MENARMKQKEPDLLEILMTHELGIKLFYEMFT